jgi:hypothetical protein
MKFDLTRICYLLYQANPKTIYGRGIMQIMTSANRDGLYILLGELQETFETWPEVLITVWAPAEREELQAMLSL